MQTCGKVSTSTHLHLDLRIAYRHNFFLECITQFSDEQISFFKAKPAELSLSLPKDDSYYPVRCFLNN